MYSMIEIPKILSIYEWPFLFGIIILTLSIETPPEKKEKNVSTTLHFVHAVFYISTQIYQGYVIRMLESCPSST